MRKLLACLIGLTLVAPAFGSMNHNKVAKKALRASVLLRARVEVRNEKGEVVKRGLRGCSGTYIASQVILTAAHCVTDPTPVKLWARDADGVNGYPVTIFVVDTEKDLALLLSPKKHASVRLGEYPAIGDDVLNVGSPLGLEFLVSQGVVSQVYYRLFKNRDVSYLLTSAMINPGSSGGGAFDSLGELVGVNVMSPGFFGFIGIAIAVDLQTIRRFLLESGYKGETNEYR